MKKLFTMLLLLLGVVTAAQADHLIVAGETMNLGYSSTRTISNSYIKSGTVRFNPGYNRLELINATIDMTKDWAALLAINVNMSPSGSNPFSIYLEGTNTIIGYTCIQTSKDLRINGTGTLNIDAGNRGIELEKGTSLDIYGARVDITSVGFSIHGEGSNKLSLTSHGAFRGSASMSGYTAIGGISSSNITFNTASSTLVEGSYTGSSIMLGDNYHLTIAGEKVTPFNRDAVTGDNIKGTVSVEMTGQTITNYTGLRVRLTDATITGSKDGIEYEDLTREIEVLLSGNNTINVSGARYGFVTTGGIRSEALTIRGKEGTLTINAAFAVTHLGDVTIKDCTLNALGRSTGIYMHNSEKKLTFDNATVHATGASSTNAAIMRVASVEYKNACMPTSPIDAVFNETAKGFTSDGNNELLTDVTIEPAYGIVVCETPLTKAMGTSEFTVTGEGIEGTVTYDPATNTLKLDNASLVRSGRVVSGYPATITVLEANGDKAITGAKYADFAIDFTGDCKINHSKSYYTMYSIFSRNDLYFQGSGNADIYGSFGVFISGSRKVRFAMSTGAEMKVQAYNNAFSGSDTEMVFDGSSSKDATYRFRGGVDNKSSKYTLAGIGKWSPNYSYKIIAPDGAVFDSSQKTIVKNGNPVTNDWVIVAKNLEEYGVKVFDTYATNVNREDILGNGKCSYDPSTKTLTWTGGSLSSPSTAYAIWNTGIDGLTINFEGSGTLSARTGLNITAPTTITGSSPDVKANFTGSENGIYASWSNANLTIKDVSVEAKGQRGLIGNKNAKLTLDNANVVARSSESGDDYPALGLFKEIEFIDCGFKDPANARVIDGTVCTKDGKVISNGYVSIAKGLAPPVDGIPVDEENFPDAAFRAYIYDHFGDVVSYDEIDATVNININNLGISDLTGIQNFTELTTLSFTDNNVTTADFSALTKLSSLMAEHNQLTSIDVKNCPNLWSLSLDANQLTSLDLSGNPNLVYLFCIANQLTTLDLSNNPNIQYVTILLNSIYGNGMEDLVSCLPAVTNGELYAANIDADNEKNIITKAQVEKAKDKGWTVYAWMNNGYQPYEGFEEGIPVDEAHFPDAAFRAKVQELFGDRLTEDEFGGDSNGELVVSRSAIRDLTGLEYFTELQALYTTDNYITSLDLSRNTKLEVLGCSENDDLTSIDVTMLPLLRTLLCADCKLTSLDVTSNPELTNLYCDGNQLTSLDISKNPKLTGELNIAGNRIRNVEMEAIVDNLVDVSGLSGIHRFVVYDNKLDAAVQNLITTAQVAKAKAKGWTVQAYNETGSGLSDYEGSDETGIESVRAAQGADDARYNTSGQRVNQNYRGLVITREGRKVVKK